MSPELKKHYSTKLRKQAFYIVENEINNKENPPEISAVIGLDSDLEAAYYAARRPSMEGPVMELGIRVNRDTNSTNHRDNKKEKDPVKKKLEKKNGLKCPSLPTQWRNNLDIIIPRAQFGHFSATKSL